MLFVSRARGGPGVGFFWTTPPTPRIPTKPQAVRSSKPRERPEGSFTYLGFVGAFWGHVDSVALIIERAFYAADGVLQLLHRPFADWF